MKPNNNNHKDKGEEKKIKIISLCIVWIGEGDEINK
jgi:hypothetical protein